MGEAGEGLAQVLQDYRIEKLGQAWYTPETWRQLEAAVAEAGMPKDTLCSSYEVFVAKYERMARECEERGVKVEKRPVDVAQMVAWCARWGLRNDAQRSEAPRRDQHALGPGLGRQRRSRPHAGSPRAVEDLQQAPLAHSSLTFLSQNSERKERALRADGRQRPDPPSLQEHLARKAASKALEKPAYRGSEV
jgi:hypothetical protein